MASWPLENMWKNETQPQNVEWRYFASEQGVFRIYPGVEMPKLYDPTQRPWYKMAHSLLFHEVSRHNLEVTVMNKFDFVDCLLVYAKQKYF